LTIAKPLSQGFGQLHEDTGSESSLIKHYEKIVDVMNPMSSYKRNYHCYEENENKTSMTWLDGMPKMEFLPLYLLN